MYEHRSHPLLPWPRFVRRAGRHLLCGTVIVGIALGLGTIGYHGLGGLPWIDSFLNASMILSGMGPVDHLGTTSGKLFAALYALLCGLVFIAVAGVIMAPWVHRLVHRIHLDTR